LSARDLALSVKASASSLEAAGQGALADVSCRLADAVLDLAGDEHDRPTIRTVRPNSETRRRASLNPVDIAQENIQLRAELAALREAGQAVVDSANGAWQNIVGPAALIRLRVALTRPEEGR
jgi:hypothetical protein